MAKQVFELKEEHVKLLSNMYVGYNDYCEYGAPEIDPKRPYGNSSVCEDIAYILGIDYPDEDDYYDEETGDSIGDFDGDVERLDAELHKLHLETETALQVVLRTKSFKPGYYVNDETYGTAWRKAKPSDNIEGKKKQQEYEEKQKELEQLRREKEEISRRKKSELNNLKQAIKDNNIKIKQLEKELSEE